VSGGSPHLGERLPLMVRLRGGPRGVGVGVGGGGSPPWRADVGAGAEEIVVDAYGWLCEWREGESSRALQFETKAVAEIVVRRVLGERRGDEWGRRK